MSDEKRTCEMIVSTEPVDTSCGEEAMWISGEGVVCCTSHATDMVDDEVTSSVRQLRYISKSGGSS